ncbi:acyl-CoA N-acyltransferase [Apiospora marii]|uniref:Acyl-CoA N-acyltransferase n=1 Tax=Apiospora marii TaxID=335849 RepID=A0ABR1SAU2_9PEZI
MTLPFKPLASLPAQFTMARCTPADVPQLWEVYRDACQGTRFCYFWPASLAAMGRWSDLRFRKRFQDPTDQQFKVVDTETGRIAGFARWMVPAALDEALREGFRTYGEVESGLPEGIEVPEMAEGAPAEAWRSFFEPVKASAAKWDSTHKLNLSILCVHPSYQGRGLSTALLRPLLDLADQHGVTAYLEALENAIPVYKKLGFEKVDELVYDESKTGHEGVRRIEIMLREPRITS